MKESLMEKKDSNGEVSIKDIILKLHRWFYYLKDRWVIILIFGLLGGILGLAYSFYKKPIYTATTTFVLEEGEKSGGLGQYAGLASMVGIDVGGGGGIFQGDNILELYKSRSMIEKTLLTQVDFGGKKELLLNRYIDFNDLKEKWAKKEHLKTFEFLTNIENANIPHTRLQDSILGVIVLDISKNYLSVIKPDKKLSIIKTAVKAKDEFFAMAFDLEIVKNVNDFYVQTKTKKSLANISILSQKTDSVRAVMNGAINTAANVVDQTPNLNPTRQAQRMAPVQRSQFSAETNKSILGELVKNLEMSKMSLLKETPLIQVIDEPVLPLETERIGKVKGIVFGGLIGGIMIILILTFKKFYKEIIKEQS
ncbi:Wzz/FepE/Etk N-terminal domain-containing protein [Pedobacter gandavensis]|uniref:Wzz/FepE/Etk N-terminal domain-containing protein n=1 Tax=Pedobacter gandavensis TaxID=2679963 RepID=UPI00247A1D29|nr:Wzz/FepE/Etk N-terminal domain-containing protein [Pedobacter gandavensis]WGQ07518.1 Wzz/FepE/Etk N-terminal domain-containing protein [Pedobacter gandavensis]